MKITLNTDYSTVTATSSNITAAAGLQTSGGWTFKRSQTPILQLYFTGVDAAEDCSAVVFGIKRTGTYDGELLLSAEGTLSTDDDGEQYWEIRPTFTAAAFDEDLGVGTALDDVASASYIGEIQYTRSSDATTAATTTPTVTILNNVIRDGTVTDVEAYANWAGFTALAISYEDYQALEELDDNTLYIVTDAPESATSDDIDDAIDEHNTSTDAHSDLFATTLASAQTYATEADEALETTLTESITTVSETLTSAIETETEARMSAISTLTAAVGEIQLDEATHVAASGGTLTNGIITGTTLITGDCILIDTQTFAGATGDGDARIHGWLGTLAELFGIDSDAEVTLLSVAGYRRTSENTNTSSELDNAQSLSIYRVNDAGDTWELDRTSTNSVLWTDYDAGSALGAWQFDPSAEAIPASETLYFVICNASDAGTDGAYAAVGMRTTSEQTGAITGAFATSSLSPTTQNYLPQLDVTYAANAAANTVTSLVAAVNAAQTTIAELETRLTALESAASSTEDTEE